MKIMNFHYVKTFKKYFHITYSYLTSIITIYENQAFIKIQYEYVIHNALHNLI